MSEIAGRMSIIVGGYFLAKTHRWQRGAARWRAWCLAGQSRRHRWRHRWGECRAPWPPGSARMSPFSKSMSRRMRFPRYVDARHAHALLEPRAHPRTHAHRRSAHRAPYSCPEARAPKLITREMLRVMKPGSVLVDIAVDQGGLRRDHAPNHAPRPDLCGRGSDPLLRGQTCPPHTPAPPTQALTQRHLPLHRVARRSRPRRRFPTRCKSPLRPESLRRQSDLPRRRRKRTAWSFFEAAKGHAIPPPAAGFSGC